MGNLQFNHFLVKDDEPLLFHTGLRGMHREIREAVSKLIHLSELRHISFSHFESDECGSLNEWLAAAPKADVICSQVGALVSVNDFIGRESRALTDGGTFATGKYRFRYCQTPHLPHGWDAGVLFEETQRTLLCSDRFHQIGDVEPLTSADVVGPLASGDEGISGGHSRGLRALHTTHRAEREKARRPKAQNARHHAWL
jgi:flavorubredoxin